METGLIKAQFEPRVVEWQISTVVKVKVETGDVKTFTLTLPHWTPHLAGQHYDVRLTAPDGYQAQRSYSIASAPEKKGVIDLTVERLDDGEVSTYLHDVLILGDQVELRGPIGGYFVWDASMGGPLLLVAGGSGIVPLMAMLRHRKAVGSRIPVRLVYSARTWDDLIYREELDELAMERTGFEVYYTLTRLQPQGWQGYSRRVDRTMLEEVMQPFGNNLMVYICGPTALVEGAANTLVGLGIPPEVIRTERFGPTGGPILGS